ALVLQAVALAFAAHTVARAGAALDEAAAALNASRAPASSAPADGSPARSSDASRSAAPTVASLGEGRVVCARADGQLVVFRRDVTSNELIIERVYFFEEDDARSLGDDAPRAYSGLYVTDVERARRALVEQEERLYRDSLAHALERSDGLQRAEK